jgi:hypothetical protein
MGLQHSSMKMAKNGHIFLQELNKVKGSNRLIQISVNGGD